MLLEKITREPVSEIENNVVNIHEIKINNAGLKSDSLQRLINSLHDILNKLYLERERCERHTNVNKKLITR